MKKIFSLFVALTAVMSLSAETYFLKSNWGKAEASWKEMTFDEDDWFSLANEIFDGKDFAINTEAKDEGARVIKAANVQGSINTDAADLTAGDSVLFIFRPSLVNQYDEKESGLYAMITKKNGFAIRGTWGEAQASWKNMEDDKDGAFFVDHVLFDGQNVQVITGKEIYNIKPENIKAADYTDNEVILEAGDSVLFSFNPDYRSAYDEKESGLSALILKKHGYALQSFFGEIELSWKAFVQDKEDADWFVIENSIFDGHDFAINNFAGSLGARKIAAKNVQGFIDADFAELSAGDSVRFIFRPSLVNSHNEKESGLYAMITKKNGYAIKIGEEWKNLTVDAEDDDWWTIENVKFEGKPIQIVHGNEIMTIKPENIKAYINYDDAELSVGDTVMFIFRPSLVNRYDEKESGLYAMITKKNGYAILGTWGEKRASWKNMILDKEQEDETYVLDSVIFDGKNVQFASVEGIRVIKVENIKVYMLEDLHAEAVLEAGDMVLFVYAPDTYNHFDEKESGLSALIIKKHDESAIDNIEAESKAVKVLVNGQLMIIKNDKTYNAIGTLVK